MGGKKGIFTGKQCVLEIVEQPLNIIQHVRECETKLTKKKRYASLLLFRSFWQAGSHGTNIKPLLLSTWNDYPRLGHCSCFLFLLHLRCLQN